MKKDEAVKKIGDMLGDKHIHISDSNTYIDNSRFMEFIDELATQITEMNFGQEAYDYNEDREEQIVFTDEAQEFYNEMYDEYEIMANNIMGVYSDNELTKTK